MITDNSLSDERPGEKIEAESAFRSNVCGSYFSLCRGIRWLWNGESYKSLSQIEQEFRCYKTIDLKMRPIYHRASPTEYDRTCFDVC